MIDTNRWINRWRLLSATDKNRELITSFFIDFCRLFKFDSRFYRFSNQKEFRKRILGSLLNKSECKISRIMVRQRTRKIYFDSFDAPWSERSWVNLLGEETQNPFWGFGTFSWSDQKWELLSWLTANPVLSTTRIFLCIFHTRSIPGARGGGGGAPANFG